MSKIVEFAQAIEQELQDLRHRADYAESECCKEKEKRKQFLSALKDLIEEELSHG